MTENICVVCKTPVSNADRWEWYEDGPVHRDCVPKLPCPECGEKVGSSSGFVDPFTLPFEVPPGKRNQRWHPHCALRYQHRETKRAQIEITTAAIVAACQESPLRELIQEARELLHALRGGR